jgi:3-phosphoshikimate 1-carboxyvinyltransferase
MQATVSPRELSGAIPAISSKSVAHRLLILAALSPSVTTVGCNTTSRDIEATVSCLQALGARITRTSAGYRVVPLRGWSVSDNHPLATPDAVLDCGESGSTERFLLPIVAALGGGASIVGHGRLAERPLSPLYEELVSHGVELGPQGSFPLRVAGRLRPGRFLLPGNVSSQFVSGLLMAAPILGAPMEVAVTEPVQSMPYIALTTDALAMFGVDVAVSHEVIAGTPCTCYCTPSSRLASPGSCEVEGDWSNAAFWLAAGALSHEGVTVQGLNLASTQGDRVVLAALASFGARVARKGSAARVTLDAPHAASMDVSNFPDLVPPLAAVAAVCPGTSELRNAGRLRLKESDRLETVCAALRALGIEARTRGDDLLVTGGTPTGGVVDSANDHRIAMLAAVLATRATGPVTIQGAECTAKSYPAFWEDFARLGGTVSTREA